MERSTGWFSRFCAADWLRPCAAAILVVLLAPRLDSRGRPKSDVATDVDVPTPPFWGQRVVRGIPIDDVWPLLISGLVLIPAGLWAFGVAERYAKRTGKLKRVG